VRDFDSLLGWRLSELYLVIETNKNSFLTYFSYIKVLLQLLVVLICPAIVMIFSYSRIIFEVCKVFRQREKMTNGATPRSAGKVNPIISIS